MSVNNELSGKRTKLLTEDEKEVEGRQVSSEKD